MQMEPAEVGCDVTHRQQEKNKTNGIFSTAVRSKKNGQPNGRIYTSTPKTSHPKLEHYVGVAKPSEKGRVGVVTALDPLIKKVALLFGTLIIGYKSVILTSKCAKLGAKRKYIVGLLDFHLFISVYPRCGGGGNSRLQLSVASSLLALCLYSRVYK